MASEDWSVQQGHILTGGGRLTDLYQPPAFPFTEDELAHYHKRNGTTWEAFRTWRAAGERCSLIAGAWTRPLFVGGWAHSDNVTGESVYNLQTPSIFLDMRVPVGGPDFSCHRGFDTMTMEELGWFARRHAFAGYTRPASSKEGGPLVAVRHHAIDWNYVGAPRSRPNKWRVEMGPGGQAWKEWGFAKDEFGQHVYMERWERLEHGAGPFLALRRRPSPTDPCRDDASVGGSVSGTGGPASSFSGSVSGSRFANRDAFLIVCGDHFGLIVDRPVGGGLGDGEGHAPGSLTALVDEAVARGDRDLAVGFLSLEASHGRISGAQPWTIDWSLHPWLVGTRPFLPGDLTVEERSKDCSEGGCPTLIVRWRRRRRQGGGGHPERVASEGSSPGGKREREGRGVGEREEWEEWEVLENTFGRRHLERVLSGRGQEARARL